MRDKSTYQKTPEGYEKPDWTAPLDIDERLAQMPDDRTTKGMILQSLVDKARETSGQTPGRGRYVAFKNYPLRELIELMPQVARLTFPGETERQAIRKLGNRTYYDIKKSKVGKVLFSLAGNDLGAILKLTSKIYSTVSQVDTKLVELASNHALFELRNVWSYPHSYHVGLFEAVMEDYSAKNGQVFYKQHSLSEVDLRLVWE
ncbi:MAG: DUF2378 family protein [Deltaproteobacteria bacterium]|nr:DUF2378 family protein [Deltaproteobacteria bacterium]